MSREDAKPIVVLGISKDNNLIKQTYKNLVIVENSDNAPWPLFFNDLLNQGKGHLLFCLGPHQALNYKYVDDVVKLFIRFPNAIGAMYGDTDMNTFPSFTNTRIINPPIILNGGIKGKIFNENLQHLYYFDALRKLQTKSIIYHVPKRLTTEEKLIDISKDMETLGIYQQ